MDDKSKANLVQIKGRFSVTSENVDLVKVELYFVFAFAFVLLCFLTTSANFICFVGYSTMYSSSTIGTGETANVESFCCITKI